jgi:hypothetical protein
VSALTQSPDEEPVERLVGDGGHELACVARADDGTLRLESVEHPLADVVAEAAPAERKVGWTLFAVMFGASPPRAKVAADPLAPLRAWIAEDAARGARVYRTVGGYRFLVTSPELAAASDEADDLLARLGADATYRRSCRALGRYAVRLATPAELASCRFVEALGCAAAGDAAKLVKLHDRHARAHSDLELG